MAQRVEVCENGEILNQIVDSVWNGYSRPSHSSNVTLFNLRLTSKQGLGSFAKVKLELALDMMKVFGQTLCSDCGATEFCWVENETPARICLKCGEELNSSTVEGNKLLYASDEEIDKRYFASSSTYRHSPREAAEAIEALLLHLSTRDHFKWSFKTQPQALDEIKREACQLWKKATFARWRSSPQSYYSQPPLWVLCLACIYLAMQIKGMYVALISYLDGFTFFYLFPVVIAELRHKLGIVVQLVDPGFYVLEIAQVYGFDIDLDLLETVLDPALKRIESRNCEWIRKRKVPVASVKEALIYLRIPKTPEQARIESESSGDGEVLSSLLPPLLSNIEYLQAGQTAGVCWESQLEDEIERIGESIDRAKEKLEWLQSSVYSSKAHLKLIQQYISQLEMRLSRAKFEKSLAADQLSALNSVLNRQLEQSS